MALISTLTPLEEKLLLTRVAAGDEAAFAQLFHAWRDQLYTLLFRITNNTQQAEDALQDVFVRIWLYRHRLKEVEHFGGYLYRMAQNHAISGMRRLSLETLMLADLKNQTVQNGIPPDEALLYKQVQERLQQAVDKLPAQQRLVYQLGREQGLDRNAIAEKMGISVSTVKNHMTMALKAIRAELGADYPILSMYCLLLAGELLLA